MWGSRRNGSPSAITSRPQAAVRPRSRPDHITSRPRVSPHMSPWAARNGRLRVAPVAERGENPGSGRGGWGDFIVLSEGEGDEYSLFLLQNIVGEKWRRLTSWRRTPRKIQAGRSSLVYLARSPSHDFAENFFIPELQRGTREMERIAARNGTEAVWAVSKPIFVRPTLRTK